MNIFKRQLFGELHASYVCRDSVPVDFVDYTLQPWKQRYEDRRRTEPLLFSERWEVQWRNPVDQDCQESRWSPGVRTRPFCRFLADKPFPLVGSFCFGISAGNNSVRFGQAGINCREEKLRVSIICDLHSTRSPDTPNHFVSSSGVPATVLPRK